MHDQLMREIAAGASGAQIGFSMNSRESAGNGHGRAVPARPRRARI
jgi:hypothetical protein